MPDIKKPVEEVSAEEAQQLFANAAKALGGNRARATGFHRVSIPVEEPVRSNPVPKTEPVRPAEEPVTVAEEVAAAVEAPVEETRSSKRKAWYLRRRKEEEEGAVKISDKGRKEAAPLPEEEPVREYEPAVREYDPEEEERYEFGATAVIPSAVVFDAYDDYEGEEDEEEYEYTGADIEEEVAFSALEEALRRHADVYGDPRKNRPNRYHDYGFGMGITFDGPSYEDDEDDRF